jgi:hypothetical protein
LCRSIDFAGGGRTRNCGKGKNDHFLFLSACTGARIEKTQELLSGEEVRKPWSQAFTPSFIFMSWYIPANLSVHYENRSEYKNCK